MVLSGLEAGLGMPVYSFFRQARSVTKRTLGENPRAELPKQQRYFDATNQNPIDNVMMSRKANDEESQETTSASLNWMT